MIFLKIKGVYLDKINLNLLHKLSHKSHFRTGVAFNEKYNSSIVNKFKIEKIGAFTYSNNNRTIGLLEMVGFLKIET